MNLSFQHVSGEQKHSRAISVCAYVSDKFSVDKHLKPFAEFVAEGQEGYDILVFREPGMDVPVGPTTRVFDVTSEQQGYARHLWRYLGGELGYDWTWFRGMDTPKVPDREQRLERATVACGSDVLLWQSESTRFLHCWGRFGATKAGIKSFLTFLKEKDEDDINTTDWHADEILITEWIKQGNAKVSLALDRSLAIQPASIEWILHRLICGHHTTIFKDRDDR